MITFELFSSRSVGWRIARDLRNKNDIIVLRIEFLIQLKKM